MKIVGYAGLTIAVSALLFGLFYQVRYAQQAEHGAADYARHAAREAYKPCRHIARTEFAECAANAKREYELNRNDNRRDYADLVAQQRAALWAAVMGIAALIGMALSAVGVWLVYTTFREAKRSANAALEAVKETRASNAIAREAMTAENRAWIKIEVVEHHDWHAFPDTYHFSVTVKLTNIGKSFARRVKIEAALFLTEGEFGGCGPQVENFSKDFGRHKNDFYSANLFPEETRVWKIDAGLSKAHVEAQANRSAGTVPVSLCLIAQYWTVFDEPEGPPRQTCSLHSVRRKDGNAILLLPDDHSVFSPDIILMHPWQDAGFAS